MFTTEQKSCTLKFALTTQTDRNTGYTLHTQDMHYNPQHNIDRTYTIRPLGLVKTRELVQKNVCVNHAFLI